jgi:hypothetical protein
MASDRMKRVAGIFTGVVSVVAVFVIWKALRTGAEAVNVGTFLILALTLVTLIWYGYDTNTIARVTQERWSREGVLSTGYSIELVGEKGDKGHTVFRLHNPSQLVVKTKVNCNFQMYGTPIEAGNLYDGKEAWVLFPQQMSQGWFEIQSLLAKKGKNVGQMIAESAPSNRKEQFTMDLQLDFSDELGATRRLPTRRHYFDFERWQWIPQLGEGAS